VGLRPLSTKPPRSASNPSVRDAHFLPGHRRSRGHRTSFLASLDRFPEPDPPTPLPFLFFPPIGLPRRGRRTTVAPRHAQPFNFGRPDLFYSFVLFCGVFSGSEALSLPVQARTHSRRYPLAEIDDFFTALRVAGPSVFRWNSA